MSRVLHGQHHETLPPGVTVVPSMEVPSAAAKGHMSSADGKTASSSTRNNVQDQVLVQTSTHATRRRRDPASAASLWRWYWRVRRALFGERRFSFFQQIQSHTVVIANGRSLTSASSAPDANPAAPDLLAGAENGAAGPGSERASVANREVPAARRSLVAESEQASVPLRLRARGTD